MQIQYHAKTAIQHCSPFIFNFSSIKDARLLRPKYRNGFSRNNNFNYKRTVEKRKALRQERPEPSLGECEGFSWSRTSIPRSCLRRCQVHSFCESE